MGEIGVGTDGEKKEGKEAAGKMEGIRADEGNNEGNEDEEEEEKTSEQGDGQKEGKKGRKEKETETEGKTTTIDDVKDLKKLDDASSSPTPAQVATTTVE